MKNTLLLTQQQMREAILHYLKDTGFIIDPEPFFSQIAVNEVRQVDGTEHFHVDLDVEAIVLPRNLNFQVV